MIVRIHFLALSLITSAVAISAAHGAEPQYTFSTLVEFNGANGSKPISSLLNTDSGVLIGTTQQGGINDRGTIFSISKSTGDLLTLASFNGLNGFNPAAGVIQDSQGNLIGTTDFGGSNDKGTVFKFVTNTNEVETIGTFNGSNGYNPYYAGVVQDSVGNIYGSTALGGTYGFGTVFKIDAVTGSLVTLHSFSGGVDGNGPRSLYLDSNGVIYGTTGLGGDYGKGSIFTISTVTNQFNTLLSFDGTNGSLPYSGLTADSEGNLYGTTTQVHLGSFYFPGSVFKISADTHQLETVAIFFGPNGGYPIGNLLIDENGNIFGTTSGESLNSNNFGTVFEISAGSSTVNTLATFYGPNGARPYAGLAMDDSGNLYGTTRAGGQYDLGTVFKLTRSIPETSSIYLVLTSFAGLGLFYNRSRSIRRS